MNNDNMFTFSMEDPCPVLMEEPPLLEFGDLFPTHQDLTQITERIGHIDISLNTQDLRIELERMKRRKLRTSINNIKREILPNNNAVAQLQNDLMIMRERMDALEIRHSHEMVRISSLTYRSLARVHHLFVTILPHLIMPPDNHFETVQLANELIRTIQQLHAQTFINL